MKIKKKNRYHIFAAFLVVFGVFICYIRLTAPFSLMTINNGCYENALIAHGGGAINGEIYTNSKEAVLQSLEAGYKYIEVDLFQLKDGTIVCAHLPQKKRFLWHKTASPGISYLLRLFLLRRRAGIV